PTNGGLTWTSATTTQGSCSVSTPTLSCALGTIAPGAPVTVVVYSPATTPTTACQSQPNPVALATAGGGLSAQDSGSLTCTPPPVSANCVVINALQGVAITPVTMTATGGTGTGYTFSATGLPNGLVMSAGGTISGTPTQSGTFIYT